MPISACVLSKNEINFEFFAHLLRVCDEVVINFNAGVLDQHYIQKLKDEGKFGEEYEVHFSLHPHPLFDTPETKGGPPLESYRMVFIDTNKI